jgi:hypothetical protein
MSLRARIGHLLARACKAYVARKKLEPRIIGRRLAKNYLVRYYPYGRRTTFEESVAKRVAAPLKGATTPPPEIARRLNLFLHNFQDSDRDKELHSHPHKWGLALVLSGGYHEERVHDPLWVQALGLKPLIQNRTYLPLSFNFLESIDFHRIDLIEEDAWTLFLVGPEVASWGFWDRVTGKFVPYEGD